MSRLPAPNDQGGFTQRASGVDPQNKLYKCMWTDGLTLIQNQRSAYNFFIPLAVQTFKVHISEVYVNSF